MKKTIYLDYNATTPLDEHVIKAIESTLERGWGNPSSSHEYVAFYLGVNSSKGMAKKPGKW